MRRDKASQLQEQVDSIRTRLPARTQRAMDAASEKGASNWLTALPLEEQGFFYPSLTSATRSTYGTAGTHHVYPASVFAGKASPWITAFRVPTEDTWAFDTTRSATFSATCWRRLVPT